MKTACPRAAAALALLLGGASGALRTRHQSPEVLGAEQESAVLAAEEPAPGISTASGIGNTSGHVPASVHGAAGPKPDASSEHKAAAAGRSTARFMRAGLDFASRSARVLTESKVVKQAEETASSSGVIFRIVVQLVFGLLYYYIIVSKYPVLNGAVPPAEAVELQQENEITAALKGRAPNCLLAFLCSGPRAAHTFHATDIMPYWIGLVLMTFLPCCTLFGANSCTPLNERLGGNRRNPVMGCLCACFCSCCVILQDAEALDLVAGVKTDFCGVISPKKPDGES